MITLYGDYTTNTHKISIALEELDLPHHLHSLSLQKGKQHESWFLDIAPNNKVPVIEDGSTGITVWESGAILMYLAEKYDHQGRLLPRSGKARYEALQCAFFQAAHVGPTLGRLNDQIIAPNEDKIPGMINMFMNEAFRIATVLNRILSDNRLYLAGDYSIADIMHYPWLKAVLDRNFPALMQKPKLVDWLNRIGERTQVIQGMSAFAEPSS